uniref:Uncharacterized protein n=1 Tax=Arundo donax TaxID=35708 RepID=A0A0A9E4M5_ARUDO
MPWPSSSPPPR